MGASILRESPNPLLSLFFVSVAACFSMFFYAAVSTLIPRVSLFTGERLPGEWDCMNLWRGDKPNQFLGDSMDLTRFLGLVWILSRLSF